MSARGTSRGIVTAEFALVLVVFMTCVCALLELVRAMYLFGTLSMVTQRAAVLAANANFRDAAALQQVREQALFRNSPGMLIMGDPVGDAHVRISYLSLSGPPGEMIAPIAAGALPACPVDNRVACLRDPYGNACIRLVKVQICDPAFEATCERVAYRSVFSSLPLPLKLPSAPAIAPAETLGAMPGDAPCGTP